MHVALQVMKCSKMRVHPRAGSPLHVALQVMRGQRKGKQGEHHHHHHHHYRGRNHHHHHHHPHHHHRHHHHHHHHRFILDTLLHPRVPQNARNCHSCMNDRKPHAQVSPGAGIPWRRYPHAQVSPGAGNTRAFGSSGAAPCAGLPCAGCDHTSDSLHM